MAPRSDIRNPAPSLGPYQPAVRPTKPPRRAPAIPSNMVTIKPPGSRPGINSFAIAPTIKPNRIQPRIPIMAEPPRRPIAVQKPGPEQSVTRDEVEVFESAPGIEQDDRFSRLDGPARHEPLDGDQSCSPFRCGADALEPADGPHRGHHGRVGNR